MAAKKKLADKAKEAKSAQKTNMVQVESELKKDRKLISKMNNREQIMKWALIILAVILLLLVLFAGYATDWMRGLNKDSNSVSPTSSQMNGASGRTTTGATGSGSSTTTSNNGGSTDASKTGATSGSTTNTSGTKNTSSTTNNSSKESTSTSSNTSMTDTTTNNNTTTQPSSGLLSLYADSSVGSNISSLLNNASLLGISKNCRNEILIQVCDFTDGNATVTSKNLLGTGIVTSITKDF